MGKVLAKLFAPFSNKRDPIEPFCLITRDDNYEGELIKQTYTKEAAKNIVAHYKVFENHNRNIITLFDEVISLLDKEQNLAVIVLAVATKLKNISHDMKLILFTDQFNKFMISMEDQFKTEGNFGEVKSLFYSVDNKCNGYFNGIALLALIDVLDQYLIDYLKAYDGIE